MHTKTLHAFGTYTSRHPFWLVTFWSFFEFDRLPDRQREEVEVNLKIQVRSDYLIRTLEYDQRIARKVK